jgi:hypothetical protein
MSGIPVTLQKLTEEDSKQAIEKPIKDCKSFVSFDGGKQMANPFGSSQVNQMLVHLSSNGLIYKNRHGKYAFAVPLLGKFILRQEEERTRPMFT